MLVRISTLQRWMGEPVPRTTNIATLVKQDGSATEMEVEPYQYMVSVPPEIDGAWSDEELAESDLIRPVSFVVPEDKQIVQGTQQFVWVGETLHEQWQVEDIPPPPPEPTLQEHLANMGIDFNELKAAILAP